MIPEPKPKFLKVLMPASVKVKCLVSDGQGSEPGTMDMIINPLGAAWQTLAFKVDENNQMLGPWEP